MKKSVLILSGIAFATLFNASSMARPGSGHHEQLRSIFRQLDLSFSQRQDIRAIFSAGKEDMRVYHQDIRTMRGDIKDLLQSDNYNTQAVMDILQDNKSVLQSLATQKLSNKRGIKQILSQEQRLKFEELVQNKLENRPQRDGERRKQKLIEKLALTEAQLDTVEPLLEQVRTSRQALMVLFKEYRQAQRTFVVSDELDQEQWLANFDAYFEQFMLQVAAVTDAKHALIQVLSEEQVETLMAMGKRRGFLPV